MMRTQNDFFKRISIFSIFTLIVLSSCQPSSSSADVPTAISETSGNDQISNIQVKTVTSQKYPGNTEEFPLPNCGGTGKLTQSLGTQASVSKTVEIGTAVEVSGGGAVAISEIASVSLEMAIEAAYQQEYETANSRLDTIGMEAAPRTHVVYTVEWEKQEFSSIVTFEYDRELLQSPYTFVMNVPKISGSREEKCPDIGSVVPPTPIPQTEAEADISEPTPVSQEGPFRSHYQVVVGDGIFAQGTFSDGLSEYSEDWLWANDHFDIQRIRQEEYPSGCDISRYNTNLVWISGSAGMQFTVNDEVVGTYEIADDPHGYIFEWPIQMGDKLCAVNFRSIGFSIILGPDIYYHYDSYCYRGACK